MSVLIAVVSVVALIAILIQFAGKPSSGNSKNKSKAQIMKEANKRLAKDPHDPVGLSAVGDIYFSTQLWDKAYAVYDELTKLCAHDTSIDSLQAYYRCGVCAINLEKNQEAINFLSAAYKTAAGDFDVMLALAKAFFNSEMYDKAVPLLKKSLIARADAPGVYMMLGLCLYKAKKYRDCLPCFKKALDEEPGNKEALFDMADALTQDGHGEKAIKVFMHLRPDPKYGSRSCLEAGLFHMRSGKLDEAVQDFEIGLKHEDIEEDVKIEIEYNLASCYFEKKMISEGLLMLKSIKNKKPNYKDVNALIGRYQELSQNTNLQVYLAANSSDFVTLCRKFITTKYKNSKIKFQSIDVDVLYTDILTEIFTSKWEDVALFRFFRTSGATGEMYIREFHSHMQDVKAARGFCISAGTYSEEAHKYIEGRPIDLIEKNSLTKVLKMISL